MEIQYIGHSGFLVTLDSCYLLFDYYNGELPHISAGRSEEKPGKLCSDKPFYVFSSHQHEDHFNPEIFSLAESGQKVIYLLSYDIKLNSRFFRKYPKAVSLQEQGKLYSLRMNEHYEIDHLKIDTIQSTDEGVAFLVRILPEKKLIYHAGDLNWWVWPDDTKQEYNHMTAMFQRAVSHLEKLVAENSFDGSVDAAFLPLDPRQEQYEFYGMKYYLEHIPVKNVFPMHFWDQYDIITRFTEAYPVKCMKENPLTDIQKKEYPGTHIINITKKGDYYEI